MASKKKAEPEPKEKKPKSKSKPVEVLSPVIEPEKVSPHVPPEMTALPERQAEIASAEAPPVTQSGLLARYPDGVFREPTQEELAEMGRAMVRRLFPDVEAKPADDRPRPMISGAHCRICRYFEGDSERGPLYADSGQCRLYPTPETVSPNDLCKQKRGLSVAFEVNESLRDCNNS